MDCGVRGGAVGAAVVKFVHVVAGTFRQKFVRARV